MRHIRRLIVLGVCALPFAAPPAAAESQSSDSSSNCSNGRCTRVDRYTVEDRDGRRGWVRREAWRENDPRSRGWAAPDRNRDRPAPRGRDDDDDDDDDD